MPSPGAILAALYEIRVVAGIAGVAVIVLAGWVAWRAGWLAALRDRPRAAATLLVAVLVVVGPIGWYLGSPLFTRTVLEEPPVALAAEPSVPASLTPAMSPTPAAASATAAASGSTPTPSPAPTPVMLAPARSGTFTGTDDFHFGRGTVTLLETAPGAWSLRFEQFSVRNGPDLYVYLSPDANGYADGALEVAKLKATDGSFNVALPAGADPTGHRSVLIWCRQFSHLFAVAPLAAR